MKFTTSVFVALAAASLVAVNGDPVMTKTLYQWAQWCCFDSNEKCGDACAFMNNCEIQAEVGMLSNGMTGDCMEYTLEGLGFTAVDTGDEGPFGAATIADVPALCRANTPFRCCDAMDGYVCGDPHFKTWKGVEYDYQGECDLKFLSAPHYAKGLGLEIHIRTKIQFHYSYIQSAAIKLGDSVLEVAGWGEHVLNGIESVLFEPEERDQAAFMADGIPVTYEMKSKKTHIFTIDAGKVSHHGDAKIVVKTFKDWVSIHLEYPQHSDYDESVGMLGSFPDGQRLARDGKTILMDDNAFGQEWQLLPEEQTLFQSLRYPQHPSQCILPQDLARENRQLGEAKVTEKQARAACAHLEAHQEFCVHDVLAAQDLELADADAF